MNCIFCDIDKSRIIKENSLAYAIFDAYPVTEYHTLIIPKRHVENYFGISIDELKSVHELIIELKNTLHEKDYTISGYNIGVNCGVSAGQTIYHCHVHLIPRRLNDTLNPRGGVRNVIQGKGDY